MTAGTLVTQWSIRIACLLYVLAVSQWIGRNFRPARLLWTLGFFLYLIHVVAAFSFYHGWSHQAAYEETARQTAAQTGIRWGGGLYFNYAFTIVWAADVIWWWREGSNYRHRPRWLSTAIHSFIAFMFFNGAVVFAAGATRWLALVSMAALAVLALRRMAGERNAVS